MEHLYLFAPENDMALAFGKEHYTPTPVAQKIANDLSLLPLWYAEEPGAYVWSKQNVTPSMQNILDALGVTTRATSSPPKCDMTSICCHPWGWSRYIACRFNRAGISAHLLPDVDSLEKIRQLSGRATTRNILQLLQKRMDDYILPALPQILQNETEVKEFLRSQPVSILKAPWSSSGRGLFRANNNCDTEALRMAIGIIRKQGYIMGEPIYDKVQDFAMEFYSDGNKVCFAGYSLFQTDSRGAYQGNLLAKNSHIEDCLTAFIPTDVLLRIQKSLIAITTSLIAPVYSGYFGIDMMVYRTADCSYRLNPCIELNLRMNMGSVARIIADRLLTSGCKGQYMVEYAATPELLIQKQKKLQSAYPLRITGNLISEGYLPLTPVFSDTHYMAYVVVKEEQ